MKCANFVNIGESPDRGFLEMEIKHLQEVTESIDLSKGSNDDGKSPNGASDSEGEDFQGSESDWNPNTSDCVSDEGSIRGKLIAAIKRKRSDIQTKSVSRRKSKTQTPVKFQRNNCTYLKIANQINSYKNQPEMRLLNRTLSDAQPCIPNLLNSNENYTDNFDKLISEGEKRLNMAFKDVNTEVVPKVQAPPMTFDQQTQTTSTGFDEKTFHILLENQKLLRSEMISLYKTLNDMKKQMDLMQNTTNIVNTVNNTYADVLSSRVEVPPVDTSPYDFTEGNEDNVTVLKESNSICIEVPSSEQWNTPMPNYKFEEIPNSPKVKKTSKGVVSSTPNYPESNKCLEMVPIGSGKTLVPYHIYSQINWNSYSFATRKLLMAVFPRRTLATHSLTGKSSPAFTSRPPKMQLDAKKIADIIITVTQMCNVQESLVRNIITTKCSDENKMYRMRMKKQKNKNSRDVETNQENQSPDIDENKD
ncbi:uncharacterized protein LOC143914556 [Arctopsyche grandis]|uniref:uncharacterized protein LOC143914556 n=1 Tax=Arctopsyche grandis TaxID=121162 RepID=UPI00406D800E